ncbi:unnamed protein product [Rotaria sp. Silwood2]|nr:unnamed protein product [Rotaria sp. Silwood2]
MGYTFLTVNEEKTNRNRVPKIKQQRFIADGSADDENLQWKIPINDWIKLNFNSIGLYRVKYELQTLARLNEQIAYQTISPQDRLMIQNDVAALCNVGHQSFFDYLKLLSSYTDEDNFTLFSSMQNKLAIIDGSKKRFARHIAGDLIDPNIRGAVYIIVSCYGDENTQKELRQLYVAVNMTEEKVRLLCAIGQSMKPEIIENTLKFVFEGDNVQIQDSISGFVGCTSCRDGRDLVWKFLQKNWKTLVERFGDKTSEIKAFFDTMDTPIVARPVKKVLETIHMRSEVLKHDLKAIEKYLKQQ